MTRTSLIVQSTDTNGKAQQKTITYVNPMAENDDLETFAQKVTAMSTNTYVDSKRVDVTPTTEIYTPLSPTPTPEVVTLPQPTLSLGVWSKSGTTYSATISYNGDGTLSSTLGTISGTTLSITDADGIFSGVVSASEGTTYAASKLAFSYNTEEVQTGKTEGIITLGITTLTSANSSTTVTYNGDGILLLRGEGYLEGNTLSKDGGRGTGIIYALATDNYTAAVAPFTIS